MTNLEPAVEARSSARLSFWAAIAAVVFILLIVIATLPRMSW